MNARQNGKQIDKMFSEFIKYKMDWKNLNQSELSRLTGIPQERISRILNEESRIALRDFVILCSRLDVDFAEELFKRVGRDFKYYVLKLSKIRLSQKSDYFCPTSPLAQCMHYPTVDEQTSHQLLQAPSVIPQSKEHDPRPTCESARLFPVFRVNDGVWRTPSFFKDVNGNCGDFQYEHKLAQDCRF